MPSKREATSPSWRAASTEWARARKLAGALRRADAELAAEALMASVAVVIRACVRDVGIPKGGEGR